MPSYIHFPDADGEPPDASAFECFEKLSPCLLEWASRRSLLVRKYYKNMPMWTFHFLHPGGGFGMVQIDASCRDRVLKATIASHWWIDDHEANQRLLLTTRPLSSQFEDPADVIPNLEAALTLLLQKGKGDLARRVPIMPRRRNRAGDLEFSEFEKAHRLPT